MTVRAVVSKHEQGGWPFDTLERTEFWMRVAETMIIAEKCSCKVNFRAVPIN